MRRSDRGRAGIATAIAVAVLGVAAMSPSAIAADGRAVYSKCAPCHGGRGEGVAKVGAPAIAGLDAAYLARQLAAFASGARGSARDDAFGATMRAAATALLASQADRDAVVSFVAALPPVAVTPAPLANDNGRNYFNAVCGACHGGKGQGNPALGAPRIAGQSAAYLSRQFAAFASGARGSTAGDRFGAQMRAATTMLPDAVAVHDVLAYASGLRP